jgi:PAS domain S-box-containing protein
LRGPCAPHSLVCHGRPSVASRDLLDDLLDVARITRGVIHLKKGTVLLESVVDRAIETVQPLLSVKRQTVKREHLPAVGGECRCRGLGLAIVKQALEAHGGQVRDLHARCARQRHQWNRGAERVTGFSEDILGRSGAIVFTPEDRAAGAPEQEMREAARSTHALDERWHVRKDGTRFWASGVMTAARDAHGKLRGFVKIMRDQTDRRSMDARLEEALLSAQQLRARAEGANRAKDEFISTVSHELRTPLNTIRLWSRMFVSGTVQGKDVVEGAKFIDRAALAQQQLIDDLLDVSRMAAAASACPHFQWTVVNVRRFVHLR